MKHAFLLLTGLVYSAAASTTMPLLALRGGALAPPKAGYHALAAKGAANSKMDVLPNLLSGGMAGCYVSFGAVLAISVASSLGDVAPGVQKLVFSFLFPIALLNIVVTGSQLFTGNTASVSAALYEGLIEPSALVRNWVATYVGNLLGSLIFVEAFKYCGLLTGTTAKMAAGIAVSKCKSSFGQQVVKAILANWLVCLAALMATIETELAGRIMGIYICISAFVLIGLEHSVANLVLIPLGMRAGADVSVSDMIWKNLVPVTIGNILAGAVVYAGSNSYLYGSLGGHKKDD